MRAIYNKSNGQVLMEISNDEINEVGCVAVAPPEGKYLDHIDNDGIPVYYDVPLTIEERLAQLEASQNDQDEAIMELGEIISE